MPFFLILLAGAAVAAIALGGKKSSSSAPPATPGTPAAGGSTTVTLDANIPAAYVSPIQNAIVREQQNPNYLLAFGTALSNEGFPVAGYVLTNRAGTLTNTSTHATGDVPLFGGTPPPGGPRYVGTPGTVLPGTSSGPPSTVYPGGPVIIPGPTPANTHQGVQPPPAGSTLTYLLSLPLSYWLSYYA